MFGSACGVMDIVIGNGYWELSSNPGQGFVCIPHSVNTLGKGINLTVLPPTMGKIVRQNGFFCFGMATSLREGKL